MGWDIAGATRGPSAKRESLLGARCIRQENSIELWRGGQVVSGRKSSQQPVPGLRHDGRAIQDEAGTLVVHNKALRSP